jgi:L-amino acid N-acyltransferase YncA
MGIRACEEKDISSICEIYNFYIKNTVITFEETPLSELEMLVRVQSYTQRYPWLVCEVEDEIVGYAYASKWKERSAYKNTVETTVYLKNGHSRKGLGRQLYSALLLELEKISVHIVLGCIALPNESSVGLHEYFGFEKVAHFPEVGLKFEKWIDVGYWQKKLNA